MEKEQIFTLGEFTTRLFMSENEDALLDPSSTATLLITDETVWNLLPRLLPEFYSGLATLPQVRAADELKNELSKVAMPSNQKASARVAQSAPQGIQAVVVLPIGEAGKAMKSVELILNTAFELGFARDSRFLALGGGAICDTAAFASSLFMRGIKLTLVPSTLLAMVDASFGGKTGINYFGRKNMVGTFYPASELHVIPSLLNTLPKREFFSGLAEIIKSAMLDDPEMFRLLEKESQTIVRSEISGIQSDLLPRLIWGSLMVKGRIVVADLRESGIRAHLNLGHTFAHGLEAVAGIHSGGDERQWTHGEAVAWGIQRAMELGVNLGETAPAYARRVSSLLKSFNYRLESSNQNPEELLDAMRSDKKKKEGQVRFILQKGLGSTFLRTVPDVALREVLN